MGVDEAVGERVRVKEGDGVDVGGCAGVSLGVPGGVADEVSVYTPFVIWVRLLSRVDVATFMVAVMVRVGMMS